MADLWADVDRYFGGLSAVELRRVTRDVESFPGWRFGGISYNGEYFARGPDAAGRSRVVRAKSSGELVRGVRLVLGLEVDAGPVQGALL